nr:uncharacterized protein LOC111856298 isoform X1 [Paramormyrops kingsleyae]
MAEYTKHPTIQRGQSLPQLSQCSKCCSWFHCPFCTASVFKPTRLGKLKMHLKSHFNKAVLHEGFTIHRCGLDCRPTLHYHCLYCQFTVLRRSDFANHLLLCKVKQHIVPGSEATPLTPKTPASATFTVPPITSVSTARFCGPAVIRKRCPVCKVLMNKRSLKKHIDRKHTDQRLQDMNVNENQTKMEHSDIMDMETEEKNESPEHWGSQLDSGSGPSSINSLGSVLEEPAVSSAAMAAPSPGLSDGEHSSAFSPPPLSPIVKSFTGIIPQCVGSPLDDPGKTMQWRGRADAAEGPIMKRLKDLSDEAVPDGAHADEDRRFFSAMADLVKRLPLRRRDVAKFKTYQMLFDMVQQYEDEQES